MATPNQVLKELSEREAKLLRDKEDLLRQLWIAKLEVKKLWKEIRRLRNKLTDK